MSLYERLMKSFSKRKKDEEEDVGVDEAKIRATLTSLLYEEEIVEEMLPLFSKLSKQEGFDQVVELLEAKEQQIKAISDGSWFEHTSGRGEEEEDTSEEEEDTFDLSKEVELLIKNEYEEK